MNITVEHLETVKWNHFEQVENINVVMHLTYKEKRKLETYYCAHCCASRLFTKRAEKEYFCNRCGNMVSVNLFPYKLIETPV